MIGFSLLVAGLIGAALLFVVPPLLRRHHAAQAAEREEVNAAIYRDQLRELDEDLAAGNVTPEQAEEARREINRRVLEEARKADAAGDPASGAGREAAVGTMVAIPLVALLIYVAIGTPAAITGKGVDSSAHPVSEAEVNAMVEKLAGRMKENPDDGKGWEMLARSYAALGRFEESAGAYANAMKRLPPDASLMADYADALAMAQGQQLEGEPERLVMQALRIDPENMKALALAGTAAFNRKDFRGAVAHWQKMLAKAEPGSEMARSISASIDEARSMMGTAAAPTPASKGAPGGKGSAAPTGQAGVSGSVKLSPKLASQVKPEDTVFIFARAANGPRMPLAILRKQVKDLPLTYRLDDSMAMTEMKLSSAAEVIVGVRVSKNGDAALRPGDLQGTSGAVKVGARNVDIVIDTVASQ